MGTGRNAGGTGLTESEDSGLDIHSSSIDCCLAGLVSSCDTPEWLTRKTSDSPGPGVKNLIGQGSKDLFGFLGAEWLPPDRGDPGFGIMLPTGEQGNTFSRNLKYEVDSREIWQKLLDSAANWVNRDIQVVNHIRWGGPINGDMTNVGQPQRVGVLSAGLFIWCFNNSEDIIDISSVKVDEGLSDTGMIRPIPKYLAIRSIAYLNIRIEGYDISGNKPMFLMFFPFFWDKLGQAFRNLIELTLLFIMSNHFRMSLVSRDPVVTFDSFVFFQVKHFPMCFDMEVGVIGGGTIPMGFFEKEDSPTELIFKVIPCRNDEVGIGFGRKQIFPSHRKVPKMFMILWIDNDT
ncbi:hypothetical protein EDD16DRAFT_1527245 [Pisolithus croceorrhizus]|nr:hypothetical protein EDD16DRAFT_1527245 [Pisolithus croceorrhizus]